MSLHRLGIINVPVKVGPRAWLRCWQIMAGKTALFGVNESLSQKALLRSYLVHLGSRAMTA